MRKLFTLSIVAACISYNAMANVFRVNSSLATDVNQKLFNTINEANNSALVAEGDTLMIEPSATEYISASITKRLVLIGPGYFLEENPQTQASLLKALVRNINITATAPGTILQGLNFAGGNTNYAPDIRANNVIVMRCYMPYAISLIGTLKDVQIIQNYFVGIPVSVGNTGYTFSNVVLSNNFIGGTINITSNNNRIFSAVENNIFAGNNVTLTTNIFRSNIIISSSATVNVASQNIQNNLTAGGQLGTANGNQTYTPASLFAGAAGNSTDGQYKIQSSSSYLTAGYGGTQPGIFGGVFPYILSGIPPIPAIYGFTSNAYANQQDGLPVNIKVKANQ